MAERTVQTVKKLLMKAKKSGNDPYLALLELRNTPLDGLESPVQLLYGRRTRTVLPIKPSLLKPDKVETNVPSVLNEKQQEQKRYYDRNTKQLKPLKPGDKVRIRSDKKCWEPGFVESKCPEPRSFNIKTDSGSILRRNREHILKTEENRTKQQQFDLEDENQDDNIVHVQEPAQPIPFGQKTTASGRVVKMPKRLEDFVMSLDMD